MAKRPSVADAMNVTEANAPIEEILVSVDVETAGPYPGRYSLLSIGACVVAHPKETFYVELQPMSHEALPDALAVGGFDLDVLTETGVSPAEAMLSFAGWLQRVAPNGKRPVFVGFNASFDWMFVNEYFHRFLGYNPFGHNALDIKSFYAGRTGSSWSETSLRHVAARYGGPPSLTHNALADAVDQAGFMAAMLEEQPVREPLHRRRTHHAEEDSES
jgi:DNA polymerase III epsilon subunit-like protein